jgi:16S rRNA (adenine1518-N6/adenine1519-N6)-dimethyltransferase
VPELTTISTVRALCDKYGFSLKKHFGQNFLINPAVCPRICEVAEVGPQSNVLEVGPGFGTLTRQLARRAKRVTAVEVDKRLLPVLAETLAEYSNTIVVNEDILKCDLPALINSEFDGPVQVCANLPYNITSPVLMKLLESRLFSRITVMVQQEAAQRITALPGTREAGAISYAVHYYAQPKMAFTVKPGSFWPPPKVTSAVIDLVPRPQLPLSGQPLREERLFKLVRAAFGQRRKTLQNAASAGLPLPKDQLAVALQTAGIAPLARPERLTLEQYIALERALWPCTSTD